MCASHLWSQGFDYSLCSVYVEFAGSSGGAEVSSGYSGILWQSKDMRCSQIIEFY